MKIIFTGLLGFLLGVPAATPGYAQKFEAENATLTNGAREVSCGTCSGSAAVEQREGTLVFNINLQETGFYNIYINAASTGGEKINTIRIGENAADFQLSESQYVQMKIVSTHKLVAGQNKIEILKSWGWINIDYIELEKVSASDLFNLNQTLVTPDAIPEATALFGFLLDHYNKRIISGGMTLNDIENSSWLDWIKDNTGKEVALLGMDFMHSIGKGTDWINDSLPVWDAKTWYNRNGIPALMWHWRDPSRVTDAFYTDQTAFDVSKISDETSDEYKAIVADIDTIAGLLKVLHSENIPVLWRPLHEAAGGWFWWGAKGPEPLKQLWQLMFDRMVNYHGLRNLIWVWTSEPGDSEWYPGDEYVDIIGRDIYKEGNHTSHVMDFNSLNDKFGGTKMVTLSEVGSFPDPDNLMKDDAGWSWFMPWYGEHTTGSQHNPVAHWDKTMNHDYVITLDEMPDLRTYERQEVEVIEEEPVEPVPTGIRDQEEKRTFNAYPTLLNNNLTIKSEQKIETIMVYNRMGELIKQQEGIDTEVMVSFAGFHPGIYLVRINGTETLRVLKK